MLDAINDSDVFAGNDNVNSPSVNGTLITFVNVKIVLFVLLSLHTELIDAPVKSIGAFTESNNANTIEKVSPL